MKVTIGSDRPAVGMGSVRGKAGEGFILKDEPNTVYVVGDGWYWRGPVEEAMMTTYTDGPKGFNSVDPSRPLGEQVKEYLDRIVNDPFASVELGLVKLMRNGMLVLKDEEPRDGRINLADGGYVEFTARFDQNLSSPKIYSTVSSVSHVRPGAGAKINPNTLLPRFP